MLFLLACTGAEPAIDEVIETSTQVRVLPTTGWDPVAVDVTITRIRGDAQQTHEVEFAEPTVVDQAGDTVLVRELAFHDYQHGWAAADGFAPGSYLVTELAGHPIDPLGFEVSDVGQAASAFEVGDSWVLDELWSPSGVAEAYLVDAIWLTIEEVDGDLVRFRVVSEFAETCDVMHAWAETDADGNLAFLLPELVDSDVDPPFQAWDIWFHAARSPDGSELAGVEAQAVIDTRRLDAADSGYELCDLLAGFAITCEACPDGSAECLPVAIRASHMRADPAPRETSPTAART